MKIVVLAKIIDGELNIFDCSALESALSIDGARVTVVSMCPQSAAEKLKSLTRLGVERVVLLSDRLYAGSDTLATAHILSKALEKIEYDYIFCGRQTTDGDTAQVGPCLATLLGINLITNVMKMDITKERACCRTRLKEEERQYSPALLTFERINTLRFPSIFSKVKDIEIWDNSVASADEEKCGLSGSPTKVLKVYEKESGKRKCEYIDINSLPDIVSKLQETEKEKQQNVVSGGAKLNGVWAIGEAVLEKAREISDNVVLITETNPIKIAEMAKEKKPGFILWNADLQGRRNAPVTAAILQTGLCADCTALETDGQDLFMYRPAKSGNVIAKIQCRSQPVMATVRTESPDSELIVSIGKGAIESRSTIETYAKNIGAQLCASRGVVDAGAAAYEMQVGLTGKIVRPKIYIAVGIFGAVHHIVGMENSDYIIAINPDKDAKIFDYADYGVIARAEDMEKIL